MSRLPTSGDSLSATASPDTALPISSAVDAAVALGLYPASDFRIATGLCTDCATIPQALWYFREETIAVPKSETCVAGFAKGVSPAEDLRLWLAGRPPEADPEYPPLVWIAAPDVIAGAQLSAEATTLQHQATTMAASLTPKIALNRSYFDSSSAAFCIWAGRSRIKRRSGTSSSRRCRSVQAVR